MELVDYDPKTGIFRWKEYRCGRAIVGDEISAKDKKIHISVKRKNGVSDNARGIQETIKGDAANNSAANKPATVECMRRAMP